MPAEPKLLSAFVATETEVFIADALQFGSELWLVPSWLESQDGQWRTPARAIRLDPDAVQWTPGQASELTVPNPIPKAVLVGESAGGYDVEEGPSDHLPVLPIRRAQ